MVKETTNSANQLTINHPSSIRTKTSKLAQINKHIHCNNVITSPRDLSDVINSIEANSISTSECIKSNYHFANKNHTSSFNNNTNNFTLVHQNIRGLRSKVDEFLISLPHKDPQVLCLTEHYLWTEEIVSVNFGNYTLGSAFCRQSFKQGGVCIYIANHISFNHINLDQYTKEKDFESCTLKISLSSKCYIIIGIYRAPTGNFTYFLDHSESILNILCKSSTHIILCGDFMLIILKITLENTIWILYWHPMVFLAQ